MQAKKISLQKVEVMQSKENRVENNGGKNKKKKNLHADFMLGRNHLIKQDYTLAISQFIQVLMTSPEYPEGLHNLLDALRQQALKSFSIVDMDYAIERFGLVFKESKPEATKKILVELYFTKALFLLDILEDHPAALTTFKQLLELSPNHQPTLNEIQRLRSIFEKQPTDDVWVRNFLLKNEYKQQLQRLKHQHKQMQSIQSDKELTQEKNIKFSLDHIIQILDFMQKYHKNPQSFSCQEYLEDSPTGHKYRSESFVRFYHLLQFEENPALKLHKSLMKIFTQGVSDIYLSDVNLLCRMFFETIHQLPRSFRGKFKQYLPWDENSWHYFEFLGSIFFCNLDLDNLGLIAISLEGSKSNQDERYIKQYLLTLKFYMAMVKINALKVINTDLDALSKFFVSIRAQIDNPTGGTQLKKITKENIPSLSLMLDYFHKTFNIYRMMTLLPTTHCNSVIKFDSELLQDTSLPKIINQYNKSKIGNQHSCGGGLKEKFNFLRRLTLLGEAITTRSWGTDVVSIEFIHPDALPIIRNGLAHIEELQSEDIIKKIEDSAFLEKLYQNILGLRENLLKFIINRQKNFASLPEWPKGSFIDYSNAAILEFWESVDKEHQSRSPMVFDDKNYVPGQKLIETESNLNHILNSFPKDSPFRRNLERQLLGEIPFDEEVMNQFESEMLAESKQNDWTKNLRKLLKEANSKYKELKAAAKKVEREKLKAAHNNQEKSIRQMQQEQMNKMPELTEIYTSFRDQLINPKKISAHELFKALQSRIRLLDQLIAEAKISLNTNTTLKSQKEVINQFKRLLNMDRSFFYGCSYLTVQIISMINRLSTAGLSEEMSLLFIELDSKPNMEPWFKLFNTIRNTRLNDWVSLRNLLMHSDGIIESSQHSYFEMDPHNIPDVICYFILDFMFNFRNIIMQLPLKGTEVLVMTKTDNIRQEYPLVESTFRKIIEEMVSETQNNSNPGFFAAASSTSNVSLSSIKSKPSVSMSIY